MENKEEDKRIKFIEYKRKKILFLDCSNDTPEETFYALLKTRELWEKSEDFSGLTLVNVENAGYDAKAVIFSKQAMKDSSFLKKIAIYGMDGIKKAALSAIMKFSNTNAKGFSSKEEALEWLVS